MLSCLMWTGTVWAEKEYHIGGIISTTQENNTFYTLGKNLKVLEELSGVVFDEGVSTRLASPTDVTINDIRQMIDNGMDGILFSPSSDQILPTICRMCEEAGVYWGIYFRSIKDEEIRQLCEASPYYVGNTYEDEENIAYELTKTILTEDYHKIAIISEAEWDTTCGDREKGIQRAINEVEDVEIVAEVRQMSSLEDVRESVKSLLLGYPELDCIYLVGCSVINSPGEICETIEEEKGDRDIHLVTIDFSHHLTQDFESGILQAAYGLTQLSLDPYYMAVKMVNAVKGYPLEDHSTSHCVGGVMITSLEEAQELSDVIENWNLLYFSEEYVENNLLKWNNPSLNAEELQTIIDANIKLENSVMAQ